MVCEARRLSGAVPTPADLAFHRRLVAQIKASLKERRLTLEERLKALIELEHHREHQVDINTAIYTGQPMPAEEPQPTVYSLPRMTNYGPPVPIYDLTAPRIAGDILFNRISVIRKANAQSRRMR